MLKHAICPLYLAALLDEEHGGWPRGPGWGQKGRQGYITRICTTSPLEPSLLSCRVKDLAERPLAHRI